MLKRYKIGRFTFQYEEGTQPEGAVEVNNGAPVNAVEEKSTAKPLNKSRVTANKRRTVAKK